MDDVCRTLIQAAIRAPSGDNTQPWQFVVDTTERLIAIQLDETRDPTPMNSGQRMARLALGAAIENMLRAAESLNWRVELKEPSADAETAVRIVDAPRGQGDTTIDPAITQRVTNRRIYDGRPVSNAMIEELKGSTPDRDGTRTIWIHEAGRLEQLADLFGRSDALMLAEPSMRQGFLDNIRFDLPWHSVANQGMSLGTLELSPMDRFAVRLLPLVPNWIFRAFRVSGKFATTARRLVASSAGLCIVTEKGGRQEKGLLVGRAMQRAWLKLTRLGLATQPMMSLAILESVLIRGSDELLHSLGKNRADKILAEFRELVPELGSDQVGFIARFGYATPPTCVTRRLPVDSNIRAADDTRKEASESPEKTAAKNQP